MAAKGDTTRGARPTTLPAYPEPAQVGADLGSGPIERRTAACLALDIENYSVMVSLDEVKAHRSVGEDLSSVVGLIHKHGGHVLQFSGDGLLAEFPGARATVRSALHIQRGAAKRNSRRAANDRIRFRIGINVGEIVAQGSRISGDAINIAAAREQIAEPGGICISQAVFQEVRRTVKANYTSTGAARLKNIRYPVGTYRVAIDGAGASPAAPGGEDIATHFQAWDYLPAIAILPLENLGGDARSDYFSDGVVEDVIVSLAGLRDLRVIARSSTFGYQSGKTDVRAVGKTLGVGYVLSGSVRRAAKTIRVSAQLSDTRTGLHIWAESSEFPPDDLFAMQDNLVHHIVTRIAPHVREEEVRRAMRRRPENMTAYDRTLRALYLMDYIDRSEERRVG